MRRSSSAGKTFHLLQERIEKGVYPSGEALPKLYVLEKELHVSDKTLTVVFKELIRQGLLHKKGKIFISGPKRLPEIKTRFVDPPVVLLIQKDMHSWKYLGSSPRTMRFCSRINEGLESRGIRLVPVLATQGANQLFIPAEVGIQGALRTIKKFNSRFLGTLIAGDRNEVGNLPAWIKALSLHGPVVWFDRRNEGSQWRGWVSKNIKRCHFSEEIALRQGLTYLSSMGHVNIAYINPMGIRNSWKSKRGDLLKSLSAQYPGLDLKINASSPCLAENDTLEPLRRNIEMFFRREVPFVKIFHFFLQQYHQIIPFMNHPPQKEKPVERIMALCRFFALGGSEILKQNGWDSKKIPIRYIHDLAISPHLAQALADKSITAWITTCDNEAVYIQRWLRLAGKKIPEDISLLSFDNSPSLQPYPIDSVDFGFGHLGYCALHLLTRDIPIAGDRIGNVEPIANVVQRGSVRPCRGI